MTQLNISHLEKTAHDYAMFIINQLITNPYEICELITAFGFKMKAVISQDEGIKYFFSPDFSEVKPLIAKYLDQFNEQVKAIWAERTKQHIEQIKPPLNMVMQDYSNKTQNQKQKKKKNKHRKH